MNIIYNTVIAYIFIATYLYVNINIYMKIYYSLAYNLNNL